MEENLIEKIIKESEEYARENGYKLNPNQKVVEFIIRGLLERERKFGKRYCPCRKIGENPEENKKIVCPCAWHQAEIKEKGHCLCNLFVRA